MKNGFVTMLYSACFRILSTLIGRAIGIEKDKICFISAPDVSDSASAMFEYLINSRQSKYRYVWLVANSKRSRAEIQRFSPSEQISVAVCPKYSVRGFFHYQTSAYVFHTHGTYPGARLVPGRKIVNVWHGMPLKVIGLYDRNQVNAFVNSDFCIATSPFFARIMKGAFGAAAGRVLITGLPRNDWLFDKEETEFASVLQRFNRYVVWMPTFRKSDTGDVRSDRKSDSLISNEMLGRLNEQLKPHGIACILKLHMMDDANEIRFSEFSNVIVILRTNKWSDTRATYRMLGKASKLITDYSSIFVDFSLLKRPIGFFIPDLHEYKRGFIKEVIERIGMPGTILETEESLVDFIVSENIPANEDRIRNSFDLMHEVRHDFCERLATELEL
jgi:CDP-glycerol glycerophosphotransferase